MYTLAFAASLFMVACGGEAETEVNTETTEEVVEEVVEETTAEASIVGDWQMTAMDMGMEMPAEQLEAINASIAKTKYSFSAEGTVTIVSELGTQEGTYTVDGSSLNTTMDGKEETANITELTADKLVLSIDVDGTAMAMTFSK